MTQAMNIKAKVFLFAGDKAIQRETSISELKKKIFPSGKACSVFIYHCDNLTLNILQEEVFTFAFDQEKLLIFKGIENLTEELSAFFKENLIKMAGMSYLVFESDYDVNALRNEKNDFFGLLLRDAAVINASSGVRSVTVDDFTFCLRRNDLAGAIYAVNKLFDEEGNFLGPLIIGILNGRAAYISDKVEKVRMLDLIWEADRAIKEKGIDARLVVEILLIKILTPLRNYAATGF